MKKLLPIAFIAALIGFSACSSDDEAELSFVGSNVVTSFGATADGEAFAVDGRSFSLTYSVRTNQESWEAVSDKDWLEVVDVDVNTFTLAIDPNTTRTEHEKATVTLTAGKADLLKITVLQDPINHYKIGSTVYPLEYVNLNVPIQSPVTDNWMTSFMFASGDIIIDNDNNSWSPDPTGDGYQSLQFYCASTEEGKLDVGKYVYANGDWSVNEVKTFDYDSFWYYYETATDNTGYSIMASGSFNVVDRKDSWYHITIDDLKFQDNSTVTGFYKGNIYNM